ncbi:MAG: Ig-like domain-containing protein, partial [Chloroflexi bacterium]|nr:Ig-like domain-containing protein [Chloroflexota bacterium]
LGATDPADVTLTLADDDERGVTVSAGRLSVNEGSTATYTVKLNSQPTASVTVTPSRSSGDSDVTVSGALTFTTANWSGTQTVTVSAAQDDDADNDTAEIGHTVTGGDYASQSTDSVSVTVTDDDTASDATAPSPTFSPASGAAVTDAGTNITLTFGEAVKKDGSNADFATEEDLKAVLTLRKGGSEGADIAYAASISADKTVITLDPDANLDGGTVYVAISNAYWDAAGNRGEAAEVYFNVAPPAPTNLVVAPGGARLDLTWTPSPGLVWYDVHYTSAPSSGQGAVGDDAAVQTGASPSAANGWVSAGQPTGTSQAIIRLEAGTPYRVRVRASNAAGSSAWVTGMGTPTEDSTAPSPTFSPDNGDVVGDAGRNITLSFAEAIRSSAAGANFTASTLRNVLTLKKTNASGANIPYAASINDAKTVITIDPTSNLDGAVYVAIGNGYWDDARNRGVAANATFTVDTTAPSPTFSPLSGVTVAAGGDITLSFAEAVKKDGSNTDFGNEADLKAVLTLKSTDAAGADIDYAASINDARTVITLNPAADLPDGAVYVAIGDGYWDAVGNRGSAASATFTVDATGPSPTFRPADGASVTDAGANITLTFDEAVSRQDTGADFSTSTSLKTVLTLKKTDSGGDDIAYTASINDARTVITLNPTGNLDDGAVYVAIGDGYRDAPGNRGRAASATFTVDSTAPSPTFFPVNEAKVTDASTNITLTFDEAIKKDASGAD